MYVINNSLRGNRQVHKYVHVNFTTPTCFTKYQEAYGPYCGPEIRFHNI